MRREQRLDASSAPGRLRSARRTHGFTESVIREMTRIANDAGALNLAQGFPDFPAPDVLKDAACAAIRADVNQYAVTWGTPALRRALSAKYARYYGMEVDEAREVTVTCGATEAMAATLMAIVDPGDEVVVFEPFYENYGPDVVLCAGSPVFVRLMRDGSIDPERLAAAITPRTRAIVINSPNNPTGHVLTRAELEQVAELCRRHDLIAVTDEIYEHILYEGEHIPLATLPEMRDRTVTISGASKTFSVTGWRIGTIIAPADVTAAIRKVHDFLTVGAPAPLQEACAVALDTLASGYYDGLARDYRERRDVLVAGLQGAGFSCAPPQGAYYVLADFAELSERNDMEYARWLARGGAAGEDGVAAVPGSSFFQNPENGRRLIRFAFCKRIDTLRDAAARLRVIARAD